MTTTTNEKTIAQLVEDIYEDNFSHIDFMDNMGGDPCDCHICNTLETILKYWGEPCQGMKEMIQIIWFLQLNLL